MPMVTILAMLMLLDFGECELAVTEVGDGDNDQCSEPHDGEDVREDCDGVDEFVHDGGSVGDSLGNVKRKFPGFEVGF